MKQKFVRRMFPPKADRQTRKRGERKNQLAFRAPKDVEAYIHAAEEAGYVKSHVIIKMLRVAMEAAEALGGDWFEIEHLANIAHSSPGKVLAQLAQDALKKKSQRKP